VEDDRDDVIFFDAAASFPCVPLLFNGTLRGYDLDFFCRCFASLVNDKQKFSAEDQNSDNSHG